MKSYEEYVKEHRVFLDMFRCSTRYLNSSERRNMGEEQKKIDRELEKDFKDMYYKYSEKLNRECIRETGKPVI